MRYFILLYLFIFGRTGSSLLYEGLLLLRCVGFSVEWSLWLWSTGSRCTDFSECSTQAQ